MHVFHCLANADSCLDTAWGDSWVVLFVRGLVPWRQREFGPRFVWSYLWYIIHSPSVLILSYLVILSSTYVLFSFNDTICMRLRKPDMYYLLWSIIHHSDDITEHNLITSFLVRCHFNSVISTYFPTLISYNHCQVAIPVAPNLIVSYH
jgi:hypothetical protein